MSGLEAVQLIATNLLASASSDFSKLHQYQKNRRGIFYSYYRCITEAMIMKEYMLVFVPAAKVPLFEFDDAVQAVHQYDPSNEVVILVSITYTAKGLRQHTGDSARVLGSVKRKDLLAQADDVAADCTQIVTSFNNTCVRAGCEQTGEMQVCAKCTDARYCCKECQISDWVVHKQMCSFVAYAKAAAKSSK
jgi:MYND finger